MQIDVPEVKTASDLNLVGIDFITDGDQYLSFTLGEEHYGVDILTVTEIRGWEAPTRLPNSPQYVLGVINLRGIIVPILDLRLRFSLGEASYSPTTVVIILAILTPQCDCTMGFVVDAVSDVINADNDNVKPSPDFGGSVAAKHIQGLVNVGTDVVTLLNVESLLTLESMEPEYG